MNSSPPSDTDTPKRTWLGAIGPALIVAAVVLGPGSILTSSKVGCEYGYELLWMLAAAGLLMAATTATSAVLGQSFSNTLCGELASRLGRPAAAIVGLTLFLIVACFQSSNNTAVLAGIEPFFGANSFASVLMLLGLLNACVIAVLMLSRDLYSHIEKLMKLLIAIMIIGFLINLIFAAPSITQVAFGLIPSIPDGISGDFFPTVEQGTIIDPWWATQGMIATTFSIAGAFYQSYLVREKGWTSTELRRGLADSAIGIAVLVLASAMIMVTSAAVLHGRVAASELKSAADVAAQLKPLFGLFATVLFSVGIFAGAFSSFLVNAMIGGTLLADGFGWNPSIDGRPAKRCTVAALLAGFLFASAMQVGAVNKVDVIIFAQALTVLGGPVLALTLLYLGIVLEKSKRPSWIIPVAIIACVVTTMLAARTAWKIWLTVTL
ncbi:NRAMP family divalent metal transporter [Stratiformator vulcanicus]|uniref:Divalent metal cation transporter MntH n=1 Tax=Stratiformator vulcanicus TaxID=2527980 RepID=A0A517R1B0_9PLAN|nr:divalent metal cation transporter [Stratiformator vulcanicus]QDT37668.1 Divalent metal cation transporter MntH [Stratiformator vulcanicus]